MIGPFFYYQKKLIIDPIRESEGEYRFGKLDNPYSHEQLSDREMPEEEYIYIPRGRVVYDIDHEVSIIYIDKCLEKEPGVIAKIVQQFALNKYVVKHDDHYVCSECAGEEF